MDESCVQCLERRSRGKCNFLRTDMYEIWDGDVFLFYVDHADEADTYTESGFDVRVVDMS